MTPYRFVGGYRRFVRTYCLHIHGWKMRFWRL